MARSDVVPHVYVIFGATGDLTHRKLLPALYNLMQRRDIAENCYILGTARSELSDADFREAARESLSEAGFSESDLVSWCDSRLFYHSLGPDSDDFPGLKERIETIEDEHDLPGNRVFYLSVPPQVYPSTIEALGEAGLNSSAGWTRVVIEKPFGHDLASARALNATTHRYFDESQVYRIDHYLGKETVQNLLVFRFANALFETNWNRDRIDRVEITVAEDLGIGTRAGYYDRSGALRDMVQNHIAQLFTLIAMDAPTCFEADAIRQEKIKVLESTRSLDPFEDVVFGQYTEGTVDGEEVPGYRNEKDVAPDSRTETYVALRLEVANWRWQGVPFYVRTGKRLQETLTQIAIVFDRAPVSIFQNNGAPELASNVLLITLKPDEGFDLHFEVKAPSQPFDLKKKQLSFRYKEAFGRMPEAYETLLLDTIVGDQTLFVHADEAEMSWKLFAPVLDQHVAVYPYAAGSWGPEATRRLNETWVAGGNALSDSQHRIAQETA
jgi:glucose-6-phosphate 1-dehydrogenase